MIISQDRQVRSLVTLLNGDIACGSDNGAVRIYNPYSGALKRSLSTSAYTVYCLVVLFNGDLAASSSNFVYVWYTQNWTLKRYWSAQLSDITSMTVVQDGNLVIAPIDRTLRVWNPYTATFLLNLAGHASDVRAVITLSNSQIASSGDERIRSIFT